MPSRLLSGFPGAAPAVTWSDERLVRACLAGDERAWSALIDKYKNLVFSIPLKERMSREEAADIFQAVCLELFSDLKKLRQVESLKAWLVRVTLRTTVRWKQKERRRGSMEDAEAAEVKETPDPAPEKLEELEREQSVRESLAVLTPRCREMIRLLFYEHPPIPYAEVARRLGLATGSIGFIRGRCLKQLEKALGARGV